MSLTPTAMKFKFMYKFRWLCSYSVAPKPVLERTLSGGPLLLMLPMLAANMLPIMAPMMELLLSLNSAVDQANAAPANPQATATIATAVTALLLLLLLLAPKHAQGVASVVPLVI